ncbi:MAG: hypothetical protein H6845_02035 [Alphaproteobacteria bacterium]|nr:MAG: hypothetical protein H6845_02035 [Alphaproteobacteria bacterium]
MAKKNSLGLIALVGDGYFAVRPKTGGMKGKKLELKKFSRKLRRRITVTEKKLK